MIVLYIYLYIVNTQFSSISCKFYTNKLSIYLFSFRLLVLQFGMERVQNEIFENSHQYLIFQVAFFVIHLSLELKKENFFTTYKHVYHSYATFPFKVQTS